MFPKQKDALDHILDFISPIVDAINSGAMLWLGVKLLGHTNSVCIEFALRVLCDSVGFAFMYIACASQFLC